MVSYPAMVNNANYYIAIYKEISNIFITNICLFTNCGKSDNMTKYTRL